MIKAKIKKIKDGQMNRKRTDKQSSNKLIPSGEKNQINIWLKEVFLKRQYTWMQKNKN